MMFKKIAASVVIFFFLVGSLYTGIASLVTTKQIEVYQESKKREQLQAIKDSVKVIYDDIVFENVEQMNNYIADLQFAKISPWFDWSTVIPPYLVLILGACSFGMLGIVMKILYEHAFFTKPLPEHSYVALPVLGFLSGFLSIGISYLLPNIFLETTSMINPVGLILFSLLFGFFIQEFIGLLSTKMFTK